MRLRLLGIAALVAFLAMPAAAQDPVTRAEGNPEETVLQGSPQR